MMSMICSIWDDFTQWVTVEWSQLTFIIVVCVLAVLGLLTTLNFFKEATKKKPKWAKLILAGILFAILAVICVARLK